MKLIFKSLILIICFLYQTSLFAVDNYDEESGHEDQKSYHLFDHVYLYSEKKENWTKKPTTYINTIYPVLSAEEDDNQTVNNFDDLIDEFLQNERSLFRQLVEENKATQIKLPAKLQKNNLMIDYSSAFIRSNNNKSRILSVKFTIQNYIGGMAHPSVKHYTINYDLNNGKVIELSSLFKDNNYLDVISGIVADSLIKKLKDNFDKSGVAPNASNFSRWNIRAEGLLFTFDEGQVAPRVFGAQSVLVPFKLITGLLSDETIISHCLNRKSRCLASGLLTGGFLDEASLNSSVKSSKSHSVA